MYSIYSVIGDNGTIGGCLGAEGVLLKFNFRGRSTCTWNDPKEIYSSTISYVACISKEAIHRVDYYNKVGTLDCQDQNGVQYWRQTSGGQTVYVESESWTLDNNVWSEDGISLGLAQDCYKLCVHSGLRDSDSLLSYPVILRFEIWQYDITHTVEYDYTVLEQPFRVEIAPRGTTQNYQTDYTVSLYVPLKSVSGIQDIVINFEYLGYDGYVKVTANTVGFFLSIHIFCLFTLKVGFFKEEVTYEQDMTGPIVKGSIEKTWYCRGASAVGGISVPVDKFGLLAPYVGLTSTIFVAAVATAVYVKRVKRRREK